MKLGTSVWTCWIIAGARLGLMMLSISLANFQARAQESAPATTAPSDSLFDQQAVIRDRVIRLEDRMFQLSQALKKSEPEKAAKLIESLGETRGRLVRKKMETLVEKLRSEKYSDAADDQEAVIRDLQFILKLMLEEPERLEDRKEEIDRLTALRERLNKLVDRQRVEKLQAERSAQTPQQAQALAAAAKNLRDLHERQLALAENAKPVEAERAAEQTDIRAKTQDLEKQLRALKDTPAAGRAARELKAASAHMSAAMESMQRGDAAASSAEEKLAAEKLQEALKHLEEQPAGPDKLPSLEDQSDAQTETARDTKGLSHEMKSGGNKSGDSSREDGDSPQAPGKEDIDAAVPHQEKAAEDLKQKKPAAAAQNQEEALKKLESARQQLEQSLEQLRKEQQEELLAALEARVRAMLALQVECNKSTKRLADLGAPHWKRTDQLELGEVSTKQKSVGDDADKALYILREEGTTVIFPRILEQVRDDARDVAARLAAADTGPITLLNQEAIEQTLRELLDAVKQQQEENQKQQDSGGGGESDRNPPLLPGSAELKLLKSCQIRVNLATRAMEKDTGAHQTEEVRRHREKLAERQHQVAEMAKSMHESMTKAQ